MNEVLPKERVRNSTNGRQAEKSAATRQAILKAAVQCFWELGYSNTSTNIIADRAGISRGAMVHHFPKKRDLLEAIVEYIMHRRIESFTSQIRKLKDDPDKETKALDIYWEHLNTRLFTAYHELAVAARTDPDLKVVMKKGARKFEEEWSAHVREVFPEWRDLGVLFELAMDLTQFAMEGMALNRLSHDAKQRQERVRVVIGALKRDILRYGAGGGGRTHLLDVWDRLSDKGKH